MKVEAKVVGQHEINPDDYVDLMHVNLRGIDYSGRVLEQFGATGSRLEQCNFRNVQFDSMALGGMRELCELIDCNFDGARIRMGPGGFTRFVRCSFKDVVLRNWTCFKTELIDCTFTGRLQTCIFNGTVPEEDRPWVGRERNEFRGNDFSGAELVDVAFRTGIDLDQQRLPTGPDYLYVRDAAAAVERAQRGLVDWKPGSELQRLAQVIVTVQASAVAEGQRQFLMRLPGLLKGRRTFPREAVEKVVSLFQGE